MLLYIILTAPGGISIILLILRNRELKQIAKNINPNFTGQVNNTFDLFRLIKIYFSNQGSRNDRIFIRNTLLLVCVSWVTALIYFLLLLKQL